MVHTELASTPLKRSLPPVAEPVRRPAARPTLKAPNEAVVIRVLESVCTLSEEERGLIRRLSVFRESIQAGRPFWRPGQPVGAKIILSGWAARQRTLPDGRRQIFGFLLPGDSVGLMGGSSPLDEVSTVALTRVECMDALMLREILAVGDVRHARLAESLKALRRQEDAGLLDHIMRLGRQSALERTAHLFMEMRQRTRAAGLSEGDRFPLPLTQEVLSDALGLSIVHLNRTLQQMKRDALIEMRAGWITLLDVGCLKNLADYGQHDY